MTKNPFQITKTETAIQTVESDRAIQEVQASMIIAKRFPRNPQAAMDRILQSCTRPTLAQQALYAFPRGGQLVTGPSIRLAEALAQNWGNIQFGIRELDQKDGVSTVQAFAWDIETNTREVREFHVRHQRKARGAINTLDDPRDIYELVANQGARRMRACILAVIPGDVQDAAIVQCEVTQQNMDGAPEDQIKALVTAFDNIGVTRDQIEKRIGHRIESTISAEIIQLRKIFRSIKDGMSTANDWFDQASDNTTEAIMADARKPKQTNPSIDWLKEQIAKASTVLELHGLSELMANTESETPELVAFWKTRIDEIGSAEHESQKEPDITSEPSASSLETPPHEPKNKKPEWPKEVDGYLIDSRRVIWDDRIHSSGQVCTQDGQWRRKRGMMPSRVRELEKTIDQIRKEQASRWPHKVSTENHEKVSTENHENEGSKNSGQQELEATSETPVEMFSEPWFLMKISKAESEQDLEEYEDLIDEVELHAEVKVGIKHKIAARRAELQQYEIPL